MSRANRLKPMFPYYGSKHRAAPKYPGPIEDTIVEPFAGSATYSLLYPHKQVWINDLNPRVASVWRYLVSASKDEILSIPLVKTKEEALSLSEETLLVSGGVKVELNPPKDRQAGQPKETQPMKCNIGESGVDNGLLTKLMRLGIGKLQKTVMRICLISMRLGL